MKEKEKTLIFPDIETVRKQALKRAEQILGFNLVMTPRGVEIDDSEPETVH